MKIFPLALILTAAVMISKRVQASQANPDSVVPSSFSPIDWIETMTTGQTRGERNNNPGNLRHGIAWQGLSVNQPDADFATFDSAAFGLRALAKNLHNYYVLHGLDSVASIVMRWAPPAENNTAAYIQAVADSSGFDPYTHLDMNDPGVLARLTAAIVHQENGRVAYDIGQIDAAAGDALV